MSAKTDSAREKVKASKAKVKASREVEIGHDVRGVQYLRRPPGRRWKRFTDIIEVEAAEFERIKEWKRLTDIISIVSLRLLHAQECKDSSCTRNVFHWLSHFPYASLWIAERMRWDTEEFHDEELAASALEEAHHLVPVPHSTGRDQGLPLLLREIASIRLSTPEEERDNA
jgi:hypothetical protein